MSIRRRQTAAVPDAGSQNPANPNQGAKNSEGAGLPSVQVPSPVQGGPRAPVTVDPQTAPANPHNPALPPEQTLDAEMHALLSHEETAQQACAVLAAAFVIVNPAPTGEQLRALCAACGVNPATQTDAHDRLITLVTRALSNLDSGEFDDPNEPAPASGNVANGVPGQPGAGGIPGAAPPASSGSAPISYGADFARPDGMRPGAPASRPSEQAIAPGSTQPANPVGAPAVAPVGQAPVPPQASAPGSQPVPATDPSGSAVQPAGNGAPGSGTPTAVAGNPASNGGAGAGAPAPGGVGTGDGSNPVAPASVAGTPEEQDVAEAIIDKAVSSNPGETVVEAEENDAQTDAVIEAETKDVVAENGGDEVNTDESPDEDDGTEDAPEDDADAAKAPPKKAPPVPPGKKAPPKEADVDEDGDVDADDVAAVAEEADEEDEDGAEPEEAPAKAKKSKPKAKAKEKAPPIDPSDPMGLKAKQKDMVRASLMQNSANAFSHDLRMSSAEKQVRYQQMGGFLTLPGDDPLNDAMARDGAPDDGQDNQQTLLRYDGSPRPMTLARTSPTASFALTPRRTDRR